ncbi:MAG: hypothetical protein ACXWTY_17645, partial [Methylobacter sp.]
LTDGGIPDVNSLVSYLLELQKSLGLPIREACGLDLKAALKEGRKTGFITTYSLSSGARRRVPCRPVAITAICEGIASKRHEKLLPEPLTYAQLLAAHTKIAAKNGFSVNSGRGVYVRDRYREITGIPSPANADWDNAEHIQRLAAHLSISEPEAKRRDRSARLQLLRELGQLGIETLSVYLDKPDKGGG